MIDPRFLTIQKNEHTEFCIYQKILPIVKNPADRAVIQRMANQEKSHYEMWKKMTGKDIAPSHLRVWFYYWVTRIFGLSFGLKLMEKGEGLVINLYTELKDTHPNMVKIIQEEQEHEEQILNLINNKLLTHVSAIVLGLNDALVELTGALAGFTLALANTRLIAVTGLITGIAASMSMAASSYLSTKEDGLKNPLSAAIATGSAYITAVFILILPYFIVTNPFVALGITLGSALLIILIFNFYTAISKGLSFKKRFLEMAGISLGLALINFGIGFLVKRYLHLEV
jgi:VIT1/CCC1 family predicted Fe2+/Mn2+ transporter